MKKVLDITHQQDFSAQDLVSLLESKGRDETLLFEHALAKRKKITGDKIYFRGLIEFSNICQKNCLYCGIRKSNRDVVRYFASDDDVLQACRVAHESGMGSVVIQSGETVTKTFISQISNLLKKIKRLSDNELGITLSCGEQTADTYRRWFESGAHRYLLRIETSDSNLYTKIHPNDNLHSYKNRIEALQSLKAIGYQTGTGVMIGLPFQSTKDLANDLLFFKQLDIDMCGMGPYLEHTRTPLFTFRNLLRSKEERLSLSLKMIASLRLLMPEINIAATTAMQAIDPFGREKALSAGANVIMPNLTPDHFRKEYLLYHDKPNLAEDTTLTCNNLFLSLQQAGFTVGFEEWGDSIHFHNKRKSTSF